MSTRADCRLDRRVQRAGAARRPRAQGRSPEEPEADASILGAAVLVIVAAIFSSHRQEDAGQPSGAKHSRRSRCVQDNTDNNVQDLKNQLAAEQQRAAQQAQLRAADPALANATPAQQAAAAGIRPNRAAGPCVPGQPCPQQNGYAAAGQAASFRQRSRRSSNSPPKSGNLPTTSRFASNLVYARQPDACQQAVRPAGAGVASCQRIRTLLPAGEPAAVWSLRARRAIRRPPASEQAPIKRAPRSTLTRPSGSLTSSMRARRWTRF